MQKGRRRPLRGRRRLMDVAATRKPNSVPNDKHGARPQGGSKGAVISLGRALPRVSSDLPAEVCRPDGRALPRAWATSAYLVFLTVGFAMPPESPPAP